MKLTFRWYGPDDDISLEKISQIPGISGIVSAVYDVPPGKLWPWQSIEKLKAEAARFNLGFEVVESVPVHEEIKLGGPKAEEYIDIYCQNIRILGKAGVKVICYNFMPVFDWLRSSLNKQNEDASFSLAYIDREIAVMNPLSGSLALPGWDQSYTKEQLGALLKRYEQIDQNTLWHNYARCLDKVVPAAEESGVCLAVHPDDPPWPVFGLPRIITDIESFKKLRSINSSPYNGITLCTGSLGANPRNDIIKIIENFSERIHFVHLRNIKNLGEKDFCETAHPSGCGSLDMARIVFSLVKKNFTGYVRPDHGRMIWGETGRPGYGLYDRALGASYINGLFEAAEKFRDNSFILH